MFTNAPVIANIPCVDLEGARAFYGGVLGLQEMEMPSSEEGPAALYRCGQGTMLMVYQRDTPTRADHTAAAFIVEDVDATADYLLGRGVTFEVYEGMPGVEWDERGVASKGEMKSAWFKDPEGNILGFGQMP